MTEKVCPRCGAMYEDLKSTTCPDCFAKLVVVDEATAAELKAARASVERTPEFQQVKAADDERFKEQSFGACLGVIVIALITAVIIIIVIGIALHRSHQAVRQAPRTAPAAGRRPSASLDILTPLPVAAAALGDVMPPTVGPYRRVNSDQDITLSGTLTPLFHAVYSSHGEVVQVYAIPTSLPTPQQNQFRQAVELAARIEAQSARDGASVPTQTFATEHWRYAMIGPTTGTADTTFPLDGLRQSLGALFRQQGQ